MNEKRPKSQRYPILLFTCTLSYGPVTSKGSREKLQQLSGRVIHSFYYKESRSMFVTFFENGAPNASINLYHAQ